MIFVAMPQPSRNQFQRKKVPNLISILLYHSLYEKGSAFLQFFKNFFAFFGKENTVPITVYAA
jgi:hypothetical protein